MKPSPFFLDFKGNSSEFQSTILFSRSLDMNPREYFWDIREIAIHEQNLTHNTKTDVWAVIERAVLKIPPGHLCRLVASMLCRYSLSRWWPRSDLIEVSYEFWLLSTDDKIPKSSMIDELHCIILVDEGVCYLNSSKSVFITYFIQDFWFKIYIFLISNFIYTSDNLTIFVNDTKLCGLKTTKHLFYSLTLHFIHKYNFIFVYTIISYLKLCYLKFSYMFLSG